MEFPAGYLSPPFGRSWVSEISLCNSAVNLRSSETRQLSLNCCCNKPNSTATSGLFLQPTTREITAVQPQGGRCNTIVALVWGMWPYHACTIIFAWAAGVQVYIHNKKHIKICLDYLGIAWSIINHCPIQNKYSCLCFSQWYITSIKSSFISNKVQKRRKKS